MSPNLRATAQDTKASSPIIGLQVSTLHGGGGISQSRSFWRATGLKRVRYILDGAPPMSPLPFSAMNNESYTH